MSENKKTTEKKNNTETQKKKRDKNVEKGLLTSYN
jgi:hypothetical protein